MFKVFLQQNPLLGYSLYCRHVLFKLICNSCLRMRMMNFKLSYKTYKILVQPRYLEVLKQFFIAISMILATLSFSLYCYYVNNFEKSLLDITYTISIDNHYREILLNTT